MPENKHMHIGVAYRILSLNNMRLVQRTALYARGILPGKKVAIQHISPLGDPLIITIDQQTLAISREMWAGFELEEWSE